jgi:stage II sporulation protein AA (anti-sigma F factor antagonist)
MRQDAQTPTSAAIPADVHSPELVLVRGYLRLGYAVLKVEEPLEITAENCQQFQGVMRSQITGHTRIILDLSSVTHFDTEGMDSLVVLHDLVSRDEGKFAIVGLQPAVRRVFELVGMIYLLPVYDDVDRAIHGFFNDTATTETWH